jgi:protein-tyrosine phosphatase
VDVKTSMTHPLKIAELRAPRGGTVGVTFCPGKQQESAYSGWWRRDLCLDAEAIRDWGAEAVVTLVTHDELAQLAVPELGREIRARGIDWLHLPIPDVTAPTAEWEQRWREARNALHAILDRNGRLLVHCKGGLGRAGTVAARLLMERGAPVHEAIAAVRQARGPGAIEGPQPAYLRALGPDTLRL